MEGTYHLIIRLPYDDIPKEFVEWIVDNAGDYLFGQHDADEETKTTHTHVSIVNFTKSVKAMDKQRAKHKLNGATSVLLSHVIGTKEKYDADKLAVYILKGNKENLRKTSYHDIMVDEAVKAWIPKEELRVADRKESKAKPEKYDEYEAMKKDFMQYYNDMMSPSITLGGIRSWTMRWYWKRDGRLPPASSYKRNAASLYIYACELSNGSIEAAFEELKELWY